MDYLQALGDELVLCCLAPTQSSTLASDSRFLCLESDVHHALISAIGLTSARFNDRKS